MNSRRLFAPLNLSAPTSASLPTPLPPFLYGTAWKAESTSDLVHAALKSGFRAIDTAAQPRHYREDLVGRGLRSAIVDGTVKRGDIFLQTKYSPPAAHARDNCPYDLRAPVTEQVNTSIKSSLRNLRVHEDENAQENEGTYIDCIVLHSPLPDYKLTLEAWRAFEAHVPDTVKHLGISNTTLPILESLYKDAKVKPSVVQQRFHRETLFDVALRRWCQKRNIVYQAFWTLTANQRLLRSAPVMDLSHQARVSVEGALYAFVLSLENVVICNGTTSHMQDDLQSLEAVSQWAEKNSTAWENLRKHFRDLIGDNGDEPIDPAMAGSSHAVKSPKAVKTKG